MSNVVLLDRATTAKQQSAQVRRRYEAARIEPELRAIRINRIARLSRTRKFWLTMCLLSAGIGGVIGHQLKSAAVTTDSVASVAMVKDSHSVELGKPSIALSTSTISSTDTIQSSASATMTTTTIPAHVVSAMPTTSILQRRPIDKPSDGNEALAKAEPSITKSQSPNSKVQAPQVGIFESNDSRLPSKSGTVLSNRSSQENSVQKSTLKVIGVPVDGILNIDVAGAVRSFKIGDQLPDGRVLTEANADRNSYKAN